MKNKLYITIKGPVGSGKITVMKEIANMLNRHTIYMNKTIITIPENSMSPKMRRSVLKDCDIVIEVKPNKS